MVNIIKALWRKPKFEIFRNKRKQWQFRLVAPNGKIICQSEEYTKKQGAVKGINSIKKNALRAEIKFV